MFASFIGLSTSFRLFRENMAFGYGGSEIRFAHVNFFTGLSLITRVLRRDSLVQAFLSIVHVYSYIPNKDP